MTKKVVIVGGSFNPPHKVHKKIVDILTQKYDRVIIVPCGIRPDKPSANIIPLKYRKEMIKIAFGSIKNISIDFYDFDNNVYTPTYLLQERYEKLFPGDRIVHLIGEDIIAGGRNGMSEIHKVWDFGEQIWNNLNYLVVVRPGYNAKHEDLPPNSEILEIGNIVGSGTLIRKRIANNRPINDLVELEIDKYIKDNRLYRHDVKIESDKMDENEIRALIGIFKDFKDKIYGYNYPEELFEELTGDSTDEKLDSLKEKFRKLMFDYGADRYNHYSNQELLNISSEISRKILEFNNVAEHAINDGTYGTKSHANGNSFSVSSNKYTYQINSLVSQADFSETFMGTCKGIKNNQNNQIEQVCMKVARITSTDEDDNEVLLDDDEIKLNNDSIKHEINMLKHLDSIKDAVFQKVRKQHFPTLFDDFMVSSAGIERYAFVIKYVKTYDFETLREKFRNGIPLYHGCWMLARMLSAAGHLHANNIIHGNIHPAGLFVNPQDHNVTMADLEFSIKDYTSRQAKYIGTTECYTAPEVYKGAKPHPRTDMYMIGMSMIYLLGGDIEKRILPAKLEMIDIVNQNEHERERGINGIRNLILSMVSQHPLARSDDAWHAYHQLSELRKLAFGKPRFVEFKV